MINSPNVRKRGPALLLVAGGLCVSVAANAQTGYYVVPSLSVSQGYDDNLFVTPDNEQDDWITRVTPAVDAGYESELLNWGGRYSLDAESFRKNSSLDSWQNSRVGDLFFDYSPNSRLTVGTDLSFTKTMTPADLSLGNGGLVPGLLVARTPAERLAVQPYLSYRLTPDTNTEFAYTQTKDKLDGGVESDTKMAEAGVETQWSLTTTLAYGYIFRTYDFENPLLQTPPGSPGFNFDDAEQDSHTAYVGGSHAFSPRATLEARIGPRYHDGDVDPYVLLNFSRANLNGQLDLSYEFNETTLLGEVGRLDSQTLAGTYRHNFGPDFELRISPSAARVAQTNFDVDIYRWSTEARYRVNDVLSFTLSHDFYNQRANLAGGGQINVSRNLVMIGFLLTYPRRSTASEAEQ